MQVRIFSNVSASQVQVLANAFIGTQTVDGNTVERVVRESHFIETGGTFYLVILYEEQ